jgi:predicted HicB family RNase H-like nuclease
LYIAFIYYLWYIIGVGGDPVGAQYTEAQKKASIKYLSEKTDSIQIRVPKGTKERWRAAAEAAGVSMQQYIIAAVEAVINENVYTDEKTEA